MAFRLFVKKKSKFDIECQQLKSQLSTIAQIEYLEVSNIYDVFHLDKEEFLKNGLSILADPTTDDFLFDMDIDSPYLAVEYLPGQFDQRADAAQQCFKLIGYPKTTVKSGKLYVFHHDLKNEHFSKIKAYLINNIEARAKDLNILSLEKINPPREVESVHHFKDFSMEELKTHYKLGKYSFHFEDLAFIQEYFKSLDRDPTITELKALDTYWSDHCRHTTFETEIGTLSFAGPKAKIIEETFQYYLKIRQELNSQNTICLMDMAKIMGKYFIKKGIVNNIDISEEVNACSIEIDVDEGNEYNKWLLMFKNETHNHPTEVEPFGGASTCIGGAIRDPLSGRAFVYQAMRISGRANPLEAIDDTYTGKLPQKKLTIDSAQGYSSYGNQIGIPTTLVREIYDPGYKAKSMEVGFVVGAVRKDWVVRERPKPGDKIVIIGGRTGRDGIGGATGSSKSNENAQYDELSAQVQKGNAPEERKIQRLFRKKSVLACIKKCNDFGAGGASVAIGELCDGLIVNLNTFPTKYQGLNGTELALSESQERMALVIAPENVEYFQSQCELENIEASTVGTVTSQAKLQFIWNDQPIINLDRDFLQTNGIRKRENVEINCDFYNPFKSIHPTFNKNEFINSFKYLNHCGQIGLIELFDSNVGRSTVFNPLAGKYQHTPEDVSVHKLPTEHDTNTVSMATFGFNPLLSRVDPYFGAYYAVMESVLKLIAAGAQLKSIRLTFQEYFEKLEKDPRKWGKPVAALLGSIQAQKVLGIPTIGGKDSMSGSFNDLHVPPTLISFAIAPEKIDNLTSTCLKPVSANLYLLIPKLNSNSNLVDELSLHKMITFVESNKFLSAKLMDYHGLAHSLAIMSFGNITGIEIDSDLPLEDWIPASIIIQSDQVLKASQYFDIFHIGKTNTTDKLKMREHTISIDEIKKTWMSTFESIFPTKVNSTRQTSLPNSKITHTNKDSLSIPQYERKVTIVKVLIPVFYGTNSEYDSKKAFETEGAIVKEVIIRNLKSEWLQDSIDQFCGELEESDILFIPGGFSAADEPDGSGKFIAHFLKNKIVKNSVHNLLDRKGLILGICNGFQALIRTGLITHGQIKNRSRDEPIIFHNVLNRHAARLVEVKVINDHSPWLIGTKDQVNWIPISHGEGRLMMSEQYLTMLCKNRQIATQYFSRNKNIDLDLPYNPNGSMWAIEGLTSQNGLVFGRMGHPERIEKDLFINVPGSKQTNIFRNGVNYILNNKN